MTRPQPRSDRFDHPLTAAVALLLTGLLIYAGILSAPFVFDDYGVIVDNPQIRITDFTFQTIPNLFQEPNASRPLAKFTFVLNYMAHRLDVTGYHLVNILIHVINAWLVFYLLRLTLRRLGQEPHLTPLLAGLLWLTLPVHTQSVTYIVQRLNALAAMFYLLALVCYIQARWHQIQGAGRKKIMVWFTACGLAGLAGLACKEITATLPVFLVLYEWFFFQGLDLVRRKRQLLRLALAAAVCGLIAALYAGGKPLEWLSKFYAEQPFTPLQRLLTQPPVVIYYLSLLFYPHPSRLNLDYDFPLSHGLLNPSATLIAFSALTALVLMAAFTAKKNRLLSFAIFWFLGNLVIESSLVGLAPAFEHRTYLPSVFPVMAGSALLRRHIRLKRPAIFFFVAVIGVCGFWTWQRNRLWQDTITLWQDTVNKAPGNARGHHNLGLALERRGRYRQAVQSFRASLDLAQSRLSKNSAAIANVSHNLGIACLQLGLYRESLEHFQTALKSQTKALRPDPLFTAEIHNNLGVAYRKSGDIDRALFHIQESMAIRIRITGPDSLEIAGPLNNLGLIFSQRGDFLQAADRFQKALAIYRRELGEKNIRTAAAYHNLGIAARGLGDFARALEYFNRALTIRITEAGPRHPDTAETLNNLGVVYNDLGEERRAADFYRRALVIFRDRFGDDHPATRGARNNLDNLPPGEAAP